MWRIPRWLFLRVLFVLAWTKVLLVHRQPQDMAQAANVPAAIRAEKSVNDDPIRTIEQSILEGEPTKPLPFSFSSRVSTTAPLVSSLVVEDDPYNKTTTTTNPYHWKIQDNHILIVENTTWSAASIVQNALVLDKTILVFPGATLTIQGRPLGTSETTNDHLQEEEEEVNSQQEKSFNNQEDDRPMDPFVVVFLDDTYDDVSITLHPGAHIVLDHVVFWNPNQDKNETNSSDFSSSDMYSVPSRGPALQTMGDSFDYVDILKNDPRPTIWARHWECHLVSSQCLSSWGNVEISHSRFHVSGPTSYAIAASWGKVHIHHSRFVTTQGACGLVPNQPGSPSNGLGVTIVQSQFDAGDTGFDDSYFTSEWYDCIDSVNTYSTAVQVPEAVSLTIDQSTFVGYHKAIVAGGEGQAVVTNCTLMGNKFGFMGYDNGYLSRGRIEDCYFWRNGIAQIGHDAARNLYVENVVAYQATRSAVDLLMYRNMVGFWISNANDYTNNHGVLVPYAWKTWDDISPDAGRHVSNLTFLGNGVAVLGTIWIPPRGGNVNFMNSGWYHIDYTGTATVPLLEDIMWSNTGQARTVSEQAVREKIRDGFSGGGPGIVQINVTGAPVSPFRHSMFSPSSFTAPYTPPTLAEWFQTKQFQPVDPTIVHQTPPLPSTQYLDLPEELAKHNMSDWLGLNETKNVTSNENAQSHNDDDHHKIVCNPRTDNNHKQEVQEDDPLAVIVKIHTAWSTCAQLSASSEEEWQRWCLAPDSMAAMVCPRLCACGPMIRNHSDSSVGISEPPMLEEEGPPPTVAMMTATASTTLFRPDDGLADPTTTGGNASTTTGNAADDLSGINTPPSNAFLDSLVHSWWFVGMCCVYLTVLHLLLVFLVRHWWLSSSLPSPLLPTQDCCTTTHPTDHLPIQSSSSTRRGGYTSVPTSE